MENASCLVTSPPVLVSKPNGSKKNLIQLGIGCFCFIAVLFFAYRFVKNINKRLNNLEEVLGRLIEKNNQMHHYIQQQQRIPPSNAPLQQHSSPVSAPTIPPSASPTRPLSSFVPPPTPPTPPVVETKPIDLDAELQKELEELSNPTPPNIDNTPEKKEDEIPEGRLS